MRSVIFLLFIFQASLSVGQSTDSTQYVLGRIEYAKHSQFTVIPSEHANAEGMYLRKETLDAFIRMKRAAKADGIDLRIVSAARNFNHQKRIWEAKWNGTRKVGGKDLRQAIPDAAARARKILKYSSMPGTSRHHWGTDIDINSVNPSYFDSGKGKKEYEWLRDHAQEFGFCQTYTPKDASRPKGYEEEKWHWSYLPLSSVFTRYYRQHLGQEHISGFDGADALPFKEISDYIFGIAPDCK